MAYTPQSPVMGIQPIANNSTVQNHPLGFIVQATDPVLGSGEFIYLQGILNTIAGSMVTYDTQHASALAPNAANVNAPVAIAMASTVAGQFGWYQITGNAVVRKVTALAITPGIAVYSSGAVGQITPTATAGKQVDSCRAVASAVSAAVLATVFINRPCLQGQIT